MEQRKLLEILTTACGWSIEYNLTTRVYEVICKGRLYDYVDNLEGAQKKLDYHLSPILHSVDAALALPWPEDHELEIHLWKDGSGFVFLRDKLQNIVSDAGAKTQIARALCEVFAAWAGAQEAKEGER